MECGARIGDFEYMWLRGGSDELPFTNLRRCMRGPRSNPSAAPRAVWVWVSLAVGMVPKERAAQRAARVSWRREHDAAPRARGPGCRLKVRQFWLFLSGYPAHSHAHSSQQTMHTVCSCAARSLRSHAHSSRGNLHVRFLHVVLENRELCTPDRRREGEERIRRSCAGSPVGGEWSGVGAGATR